MCKLKKGGIFYLKKNKRGIAIIGISIASVILSFIATKSFDIKSIATGLILPSLYTYGAY